MEYLAQRVEAYRSEGFQSIALVAKNGEASKKAYKALRSHIEGIQLLGVKDAQFPGGIVVMPAYLTKGLQFDVVIVLDSEEYEETEWDTKLLYVVMTRPVHRLVLLHRASRMSPLIAAIPPALYKQSELSK